MPTEKHLMELGFDSLTSVQLRNRLSVLEKKNSTGPPVPRASRIAGVACAARFGVGGVPAARLTRPTLLLRAEAPTREMTAQGPDWDWRLRWPQSHHVVDIPGSHFTLLTDDAATTAAAIRDFADRTTTGR